MGSLGLEFQVEGPGFEGFGRVEIGNLGLGCLSFRISGFGLRAVCMGTESTTGRNADFSIIWEECTRVCKYELVGLWVLASRVGAHAFWNSSSDFTAYGGGMMCEYMPQ